MAKYLIATSKLGGDLPLIPRAAWPKIEAAARRSIPQAQRDKIRDIVDLYCGLDAAERNRLDMAEVERPLLQIKRSAEELIGHMANRRLDDRRRYDAKTLALEFFFAQLIRYGAREDFFTMIWRIAASADRAMQRLQNFAVEGKRGRKSGAFPMVIGELGEVFKSVGGRATVSTRNVAGKPLKDSPFAGFVYEILKAIPGELAPKSRNSVADRIRATKRRGKNRALSKP